MITERTLKKWRKEALEMDQSLSGIDHNQFKTDPLEPTIIEFSGRILQMSQELLDQHLMRRD